MKIHSGIPCWVVLFLFFRAMAFSWASDPVILTTFPAVPSDLKESPSLPHALLFMTFSNLYQSLESSFKMAWTCILSILDLFNMTHINSIL